MLKVSPQVGHCTQSRVSKGPAQLSNRRGHTCTQSRLPWSQSIWRCSTSGKRYVDRGSWTVSVALLPLPASGTVFTYQPASYRSPLPCRGCYVLMPTGRAAGQQVSKPASQLFNWRASGTVNITPLFLALVVALIILGHQPQPTCPFWTPCSQLSGMCDEWRPRVQRVHNSVGQVHQQHPAQLIVRVLQPHHERLKVGGLACAEVIHVPAYDVAPHMRLNQRVFPHLADLQAMQHNI